MMDEKSQRSHIAIIGMSCRVAGADSPSELWEKLAARRDVRKKIDRFNIDGYYSPQGGKAKGLTNVQNAYFINQDVDRFDNTFFAISPVEASAMDPQHRILLEVSYEAIESAGIPLQDIQGTDTAVYTGISCNDYQASLLRDVDLMPKYAATGMHNSMAANRISYFFDLHGPSLTIDTACSSTMVALHQAVRGLQAHESSMAIVCGSHLILNPEMFVHMSELGFLSPDGRCRSFDADGDGYVRGEGCLALLLKPLEQAVQDNDPIRAVIKGTRLNQDGKTQGITLPSSKAQRENLTALYRSCGIAPGTVQYVEAHGTGTAAGDPIECSALREVFGPSHLENKLVIGSIKSNIGHLESCAALAGIIKTVVSLERGLIPGQMHYDTPNPKIPLDTFTIPTSVIKWPSSPEGVRRAGVNSFGFGGTNGHVILEQYIQLPRCSAPYQRPYLFKISATNLTSLQKLAAKYARYVNDHSPDLGDMSYTLLTRRSTFSKTFYFTASSSEGLSTKLSSFALGEAQPLSGCRLSSRKVLFIFTGQGAQWAQMGKQLIECSPLFSSIIHECDRVLTSLPSAPQWSIVGEILKPRESSCINKADYSQPICTALQIGLVEVWRSWGIEPTAVVGHSSGEIGAAYAAGLLTLRDAMTVSFYRGLFLNSHAGDSSSRKKGAMCAIGMGESAARELLSPYQGRISLAAVNGPTSCTISGDEDAVNEVHDVLKLKRVFCRLLRVDTAYHSHHMVPLADRYMEALRAAGITSSSTPARVDMFSSVTVTSLKAENCSPEYWKDNMVSTVQFTGALSAAVQRHGSFGAVLEVGPHPALKGPAMELLSSIDHGDVKYFSSCIRYKSDMESLLETVGYMINSGLAVDVAEVNSPEPGGQYQARVLSDLPSYCWDHSITHWAETRVSQQVRLRQFARHPLLGARIAGDNLYSRSWRNNWRRQDLEWLQEMQVSISGPEMRVETTLYDNSKKDQGIGSMPESAFVVMALEATRQVAIEEPSLHALPLSLEKIEFLHELSLAQLSDDEESGIETSFNLRKATESEYHFDIVAGTGSLSANLEKICSGKLLFHSKNSLVKNQYHPLPSQETGIASDCYQGIELHPAIRIQSATGNDLNGEITEDLYNKNMAYLSPSLLAALMDLPKKMLEREPVPSRYRLHFIARLEVSPDNWKLGQGTFHGHTMRINETQGEGNLYISDNCGAFLVLSGMNWRFDALEQEPLPLESLFIRPTLLPDITRLTPTACLYMDVILSLICHKWPMCDIAVTGLEHGDLQYFFSKLPRADQHSRPQFRRVHVLGHDIKCTSPRVKSVESFNSNLQYHLVIAAVDSLRQRTVPLHPKAIACVKLDSEADHEWFNSHFTLLCQVDDMKSGTWFLGRNNVMSDEESPKQEALVLQWTETRCKDAYGSFHPVSFDLDAIREAVGHHDASAALDVIVQDIGAKSMLLDTKGDMLLPCLQYLVPRAKSLLWVSNQTTIHPFANVAGSFLRTLNSENPSMKAASLVFRGEYSPTFIGRTILEVYQDLIRGENEVEMVVQDSQLHILRYHPDDELAASVGLIAPRPSDEGLGTTISYELLPASPNEAIVISNRGHGIEKPPQGTALVAIKSSVVDCWDTLRFAAMNHASKTWGGFGHFFAGTVIASGCSKLPPASQVVGWHNGTHKATINVPISQIWSYPADIPFSLGASHFAAHAIAFAAVQGTARCLPSEAVKIGVSGILGHAIRNVCRHLGIITDYHHEARKVFTVELDPKDGLLVDCLSVDVETYLRSQPSKALASIFSCEEFGLDTEISEFSLGQYQQALQNAARSPVSTVLVHDQTQQSVRGDIVAYRPPRSLFRDDGAYVLLGGSGGLGQYLARWMAKNGARHLVIISRSGMRPDDEEALRAAMEQVGAILEVHRADSTVHQSLDSVMGSIRERTSIIGCMNLVMVLQDSPFLTMLPGQWDTALQAKVKSTLNLHLTTQKDPLDFFIMFSSIASIAGNMAQANYATGNAFQNSMAEYRRAQGLTAISIALGVMTGIGVLTEEDDLLRNFAQKGMRLLSPEELCKIVEAAVYESRHSTRSMISVGFEMFETVDGKVQCRDDQSQLFWTETAEFGFLFDHRPGTSDTSQSASLRDRLGSSSFENGQKILLAEFLVFLGHTLGYEVSMFDASLPLATYGLDSLNAVACRFWFFKELAVDVPVFDILGCSSIYQLIGDIYEKLAPENSDISAIRLPVPAATPTESLTARPLSQSQRRLWFLQRLLDDKTVYNLLLVCHISGTVNVPAFVKAWSTLIRRHEILRSRIAETANGLQQIPKEHALFNLVEVEATGSTDQGVVEEITITARNHVFDLDAGELIRGWLIKSPLGWKFFLASHHLAWDRSSVPVIFKETSAIYQNLIAGKSAEEALPPVPYQFIHYTLWQNQCLSQEGLVQRSLSYWKTQLDGIPNAISLLPSASTSSRPMVKQYNTDSMMLILDAALTHRLKGFCKHRAITPFMFMTACLSILLHRLIGDRDILIGITDGDRGHTEFDNLVGFTVNMLALRFRFERDLGFSDFLDEAKQTCFDAYKHRLVPFDYLLQQLDVPRSTSHNPIFQVMVNYQMKAAFPQYDYGTFKFTKYDHYNARSQTDFYVDVEETEKGELDCIFYFDTALYTHAAMTNLAHLYETLIGNILALDGQSSLKDISLMTPADRELARKTLQPEHAGYPSLEELNNDLFLDLLDKAVQKTPSKTAIVDSGRSMTYSQLDSGSNAVANFIIHKGAQMGDRIALFCEPSCSMIVALFGIVKAGCVYVPIDLEFSQERVEFMAEDAQFRMALVGTWNGAVREKFFSSKIDGLPLYEIGTTLREGSCDRPALARVVNAQDNFCCLFTSGTTGRPKGIYVAQGPLRYQMEGYHRALHTSSDDHLLLASALAFDVSLASIYGFVLHGATLYIASREELLSPTKMVDTLVDNNISSLIITPTQAKLILSATNSSRLHSWSSLRSLCLAGEQCAPWLVTKIYDLHLPHASVYNGYGPTESTVVNSIIRFDPEEVRGGVVRVGSPIFPSRFYILDENMNEVPPGMSGELYIGGATVNKGYLNRPELTARAFKVDPWAPQEEVAAGFGRLYRTGDCWRLNGDGKLYMDGRIGGDRQVKIRGMRTELDEIEHAIWNACKLQGLTQIYQVTLVAVLYYKTGDFDGVLAAFLAAPDIASQDSIEQQKVRAVILSELRAGLPRHMCPTSLEFRADLPLSVSGKCDYKTMLSWSPPPANSTTGDDTLCVECECFNQLQEQIANIWTRVLGNAAPAALTPSDDFFAIGGHSLLLFNVQKGFEEDFGIAIPLIEFFSHTTIAGQEDLVTARMDAGKNIPTGADPATTTAHIDWDMETALPAEFPDEISFTPVTTLSKESMAVTGGCTMTGAHFIHHVLKTTSSKIHCLAIEAETDQDAASRVLETLKHWNLYSDDVAGVFESRVVAHSGSLSHSTLGLSQGQVEQLDAEVTEIYHLDSDVSLLKNYESLFDTNVGSLKFLISLATRTANDVKPIHYLSTWGVPHLQTWRSTRTASPQWETGPVEMTNMRPGPDSSLGYLRCRWACEMLLYQAAKRGLPVSIFRASMCTPSPETGTPLPRSDINRRILVASLLTGLVPDFSSNRGGGMSWITADFLVRSMLHLSQRTTTTTMRRFSVNVNRAQIYQVVPPRHTLYNQLPNLLNNGTAGGKTHLKVVPPKEWFTALRSFSQDPEILMHATVLEEWHSSGWVPFQLEATETLRLLEQEAGIAPTVVDGQLLQALVIGDGKF